MKSAKIITFIASAIFALAAVGTLTEIPKFRAILASGSEGNGNSLFVVPIVQIIFALGSFWFGLHIIKQEKKGMVVSHARLISIILVVLSVALSWGLTIWFIQLPIYNLSSQV